MSQLSEALRTHYKLKSISTRTLASEWNTSHATVSRFLSGKPIEMMTFLRILTILMTEVKK
jgi:hypothetical protein